MKMFVKTSIKSARNKDTVLESMFSKQKYNPIFLTMSCTTTVIIIHRNLQSCFFLPAAVHIFSAMEANKMRRLKEANQIHSLVQ